MRIELYERVGGQYEDLAFKLPVVIVLLLLEQGHQGKDWLKSNP